MQSGRSAFPLPNSSPHHSNKHTEPISREVAKAAFTWNLIFLGKRKKKPNQPPPTITTTTKNLGAFKNKMGLQGEFPKATRDSPVGVDGSYQYSSGLMPDQLS